MTQSNLHQSGIVCFVLTEAADGKEVLVPSTTQRRPLPKLKKRERSLDQELLCLKSLAYFTSTSLTPIITDVSHNLFTFLLYMHIDGNN